MLHIILLILKIIGILLLCLLAFLLLCLCLILFVPIFFEAEAEKEDSFRAKGALSWLGIGLRAGFSYEEELEFSLRIFGIRIFPSKEKKRKSKKENKERSPASETKAAEEKKESGRSGASDVKEAGSQAEQCEKAEQSSEAGQSTKTEQKAKENQEAKDPENKKEASSEKEKSSSKEKRGPGGHPKKKRIQGKSAFFKKVREVLGDEVCREGIIHTMSYLITFFQAVRMKEAEGKVDFSLGAPDLTGKTLGLISMFPFAYGKDLEINPDFMADDSYCTGRIGLKGSLQLVYLLIFIIRMGMDKEVRKVIVSLIGKK